MKKFLIFTLLFFIFLFKKDFIFSQEISPTPEPGSLGGKCKAEEVNINQINFPKISGTDDTGGKWGCIGFNFLIKANLFCISDVVLKAKESITEFISIDELTKAFQELNICDPGLEPSTLDINSEDCICVDPNIKNLSKLSDRLCQNLNLKNQEMIRCNNCFYNGGYYSALGCIYFSDWKTFFEKNIFGLLIGLAGFIALICIIYSAFQLQLSQGNAEKIKKSQELLTSCILGLMLIIFSVFILKVIGVDILRVPGFK